VQDADEIEQPLFKQGVDRLPFLGSIGKELCECNRQPSWIIPSGRG
jgi:hypothetical protein